MDLTIDKDYLDNTIFLINQIPANFGQMAFGERGVGAMSVAFGFNLNEARIKIESKVLTLRNLVQNVYLALK